MCNSGDCFLCVYTAVQYIIKPVLLMGSSQKTRKENARGLEFFLLSSYFGPYPLHLSRQLRQATMAPSPSLSLSLSPSVQQVHARLLSLAGGGRGQSHTTAKKPGIRLFYCSMVRFTLCFVPKLLDWPCKLSLYSPCMIFVPSSSQGVRLPYSATGSRVSNLFALRSRLKWAMLAKILWNPMGRERTFVLRIAVYK
jgi:hypothetical protein